MEKRWWLILTVLVILASGCAEKECKTDADCLAKTCFTVQCLDNLCSYSSVTNCCGNSICEVGEAYPECAADCPNCDDNNKLTADSFNYTTQKCENIDCEKINYIPKKNACYWDIAVEAKDISMCEKITHSEGKDACYKTLG